MRIENKKNRYNSHLRTLAWCYYVHAGVLALVGLLPGLYAGVGLIAVIWNPPFLAKGPAPPLSADQRATLWIIITVGAIGLLIAEIMALLNLLAGRAVARQRRFALIMMTSILNCACIPVGTASAVFTFIMVPKPFVPPGSDANYSDTKLVRVKP